MKQFRLFATLVLVAFLGTLTLNAQTKKLKKNEAEVTYSVNLHCESCQKKVEAALPYVKGVKDLKVDLEGQKIWLVYDIRKTSKEKLAEELKKLGYPAKEIVKTDKEKAESKK